MIYLAQDLGCIHDQIFRAMLKNLTALIVFLCLSLTSNAEFFLFDNFESEDNYVFLDLKNALVTNKKPLSGNKHLSVERSSFSLTVPVSLYSNAYSKVLVSCFVDPRGKETSLEFVSGSYSTTVKINEQVFGYRQVVAELPIHNFTNSVIQIRSSEGAGTFNMDDLQITGLQAVPCGRPEPTQIIANYNGETKDMIKSFELDGNKIVNTDIVSADGYFLISETKTLTHTSFSIELNPEDENFPYAYTVWADTDRNGIFSAEERVHYTNAQGSVQIPMNLNQLEDGNLAVRIRMLDPRSNDMSDAYSGNTWGQTIDLFVGLENKSEATPCRCIDPEYYMDLSGKILTDLVDVPTGMYFKVSKECTEKTMVVR